MAIICATCCCACCECKLSTGCKVIAIVELVLCALLITVFMYGVFQDLEKENPNKVYKSEFNKFIHSLPESSLYIRIMDIVFIIDRILILIASILLLIAIRRSTEKMLLPYLIINGIHVAFWFLSAFALFIMYTTDAINSNQAKGSAVFMILIGALNFYFQLIVISFYQFLREQTYNQVMVLHYRK